MLAKKETGKKTIGRRQTYLKDQLLLQFLWHLKWQYLDWQER
jgi:hypothetical protein